jgi:hypothetical protein
MECGSVQEAEVPETRTYTVSLSTGRISSRIGRQLQYDRWTALSERQHNTELFSTERHALTWIFRLQE